MTENRTQTHAARSFMASGTLYSCLYCMLASNVMLSMPILGGALYLTAQTVILFASLRRYAQ